jgi:nicotinate-nucleotide adenylyltransferase
MNRKRVALVGGSFDPPHLDHLGICKKIFLVTGVKEIWLVPCSKSFYGKNLQDGTHRINMCNLMIRNHKFIKTSDIEIANNLNGSTFKMVTLIKQQNPDTDFFFVIGADTVEKTDSWYNWNGLKSLIEGWIVIPREGYDVPKESFFRQIPNIYLDFLKPSNISSTDIRSKIANNDIEPLKSSIDSEVLAYIIKHNLYGSLNNANQTTS